MGHLLRGHPHGNAFLCKLTCFASFWPIVHMDPVNAVSVNTLFWNLVSGWKNMKTPPLRSRVDSESAFFAYRWRHRPTFRPLAFDLLTPRHLITTATTTTMVDYMLVFVPQKILSLLRLIGHVCVSQWTWQLGWQEPCAPGRVSQGKLVSGEGPEAKLSIYWSIFIPTVTYGHRWG